MEVWKDIKGYEGSYQVSNLGQVRGLRRIIMRKNGPFEKKGTMIKAMPSHSGYLRVGLWTTGDKTVRTISVHCLVAVAFIGLKPEGLVTCHIDGDKSNNADSNLKYLTQKENCSHKVSHGTAQIGERHAMSTLKDADVIDIRARLLTGESGVSLALEFNVTPSTISRVKLGKTWGHVHV